jgi:hypothetical protein
MLGMRFHATIKKQQMIQSIMHTTIVMLDQRTLFGIVQFNAVSAPPVPGLQVIGNKVSTEAGHD